MGRRIFVGIALGLAAVVLAFSGWVGVSRGTAQTLGEAGLPQGVPPTATPRPQHRDHPDPTDTLPPPPTWTFTPTDTATLTPSLTPTLTDTPTPTDTSTPTPTENPTRSVPGPAGSTTGGADDDGGGSGTSGPPLRNLVLVGGGLTLLGLLGALAVLLALLPWVRRRRVPSAPAGDPLVGRPPWEDMNAPSPEGGMPGIPDPGVIGNKWAPEQGKGGLKWRPEAGDAAQKNLPGEGEGGLKWAPQPGEAAHNAISEGDEPAKRSSASEGSSYTGDLEKHGFNPQPEPPGHGDIAEKYSPDSEGSSYTGDLEKQGFNPQPEPPGHGEAGHEVPTDSEGSQFTGDLAQKGFNPQPEPPGHGEAGHEVPTDSEGSQFTGDLAQKGFNPQPEPPGHGEAGHEVPQASEGSEFTGDLAQKGGTTLSRSHRDTGRSGTRSHPAQKVTWRRRSHPTRVISPKTWVRNLGRSVISFHCPGSVNLRSGASRRWRGWPERPQDVSISPQAMAWSGSKARNSNLTPAKIALPLSRPRSA